jgi:hypothetical protein
VRDHHQSQVAGQRGHSLDYCGLRLHVERRGRFVQD